MHVRLQGHVADHTAVVSVFVHEPYVLSRGVHHLSLFVVGVCLMAFCFAAGDANEASIGSEVIPRRYQATAYGISNMCATTAGGLGVLMAGYFKAALGLNVIFAATAVLFLTAGVALWIGYGKFLERDINRAKAANLTQHA